MVENHGMEPAFLKEGTKLGTVTPVEEVIQGDNGEGGKVCGLGEVCGGGSVKEPGQASSVGVVYQLEAETVTEEETSSRLPPCRSREETAGMPEWTPVLWRAIRLSGCWNSWGFTQATSLTQRGAS